MNKPEAPTATPADPISVFPKNSRLLIIFCEFIEINYNQVCIKQEKSER
jgi:hypothetical protein